MVMNLNGIADIVSRYAGTPAFNYLAGQTRPGRVLAAANSPNNLRPAEGLEEWTPGQRGFTPEEMQQLFSPNEAPQPVPVPDQSAQEIMPGSQAQRFAPSGPPPMGRGQEQRFAPYGPPPNAPEVSREWAGPPPAPTPQTQATTPTPTQQGILARLGINIPDYVRNPVSDAMYGLAGVDPTRPAISAFAQGFTGTQAAGLSREQRKREEQLAAAERAEDTRRWEAEYSLDERQAAREERAAMIDELIGASNIAHTQADTARLRRQYDRDGLTDEQIRFVETRVSALRDTLVGDYGIEAIVDETERDNIQNQLDAERERLVKLFKSGDYSEMETETDTAPANITDGDGTAENPLTFDGDTFDIEGLYQQRGQPFYFKDEAGDTRRFPPQGQQ